MNQSQANDYIDISSPYEEANLPYLPQQKQAIQRHRSPADGATINSSSALPEIEPWATKNSYTPQGVKVLFGVGLGILLGMAFGLVSQQSILLCAVVGALGIGGLVILIPLSLYEQHDPLVANLFSHLLDGCLFYALLLIVSLSTIGTLLLWPALVL
ncbi:hypothetical protein EPA93_04330 [Ktedonosporobacter rubrisoli]|uniref:Uncharacterized protein n=1 Tax=Ktedonosporobacter rubrisoli TaxID=2509675 RepID=A0A4P6JJP9_KTERU|nr:hypothetical protein [Ktedonosporobacter rubrisoli]QBD75263.1 hypothetical protein EPA93_04330 [Ktedonosporobacter rubrisoli]